MNGVVFRSGMLVSLSRPLLVSESLAVAIPEPEQISITETPPEQLYLTQPQPELLQVSI